MNRTGIEWCNYTWNPIVGCSPASEGCANCYARRMARRLAANPKLPVPARAAYRLALSDDGREWARPACLTLLPERLCEPARVKKPSKVFVCSMSDLGHDSVLQEWRVFILLAMLAAPWHTYIVLTKRPRLWMEVFDVPRLRVWLGVTAENQARANERIPELLHHGAYAAVRFVSVEPMLGPVDLCGLVTNGVCLDSLDWVIAGPETGRGARECRVDWIGALADQCERARVAFFDKRKTWLRREWPEDLRAGRVARARTECLGISPRADEALKGMGEGNEA